MLRESFLNYFTNRMLSKSSLVSVTRIYYSLVILIENGDTSGFMANLLSFTLHMNR